MTAQELISTFGLRLAPDHGPDAITPSRFGKKPTAQQVEEIKANKPAILELLRARLVEQQERDARFEAEGKARIAREEAAFEAVKAEQLPALLAQIPEGAVRVTVRRADFDRNTNVYHVGEHKIFHMDVTVVGTVWDATGHRREVVAYITAERLAELEAADAAKVAEKEAAEAERAAKFEEARRGGNPVWLYQTTDTCNDPREECSLDIIAVYAMPDGSTKEERSHTW